MIFEDKREQVIENIRQAAEKGMFDAKVEVNNPKLTAQQLEKLLDDHVKKRPSMRFCIDSWIARQITNITGKKRPPTKRPTENQWIIALNRTISPGGSTAAITMDSDVTRVSAVFNGTF